MSKNLLQAAHEWATRPADERFETLDALYLHTLFAAQRAQQRNVHTNQMRVRAVDGNIVLDADDQELRFNNWSFGQLTRKVGAPADWLRRLPAELVEENLNWAIQNADGDDRTQLWYDGQSAQLRAATGQAYARILNHEVVAAVINLGDDWLTPPARPCAPGQPGSRIATEKDCLGSNHPHLAIKPGDWIAPAGLYGGDRNIFIFRVNPNIRLDDGTDGGLGRGFFVRNSEVGDAAFELVAFWYRYVCGNHIVWGCEHVTERRFRHMGAAKTRAFDAIRTDLDRLAGADLTRDANFIQKAKVFELGSTQDDVVDLVFGKRKLLSKRDTEAAFLMAEQNEAEDGIPTMAWGFAQGITRMSQLSQYADERTRLDRVAGEILAMAN